MDKTAVQKLTEKGCMVDKEAAEILEEDDVENIQGLEPMPMVISRKLVTNLREQDTSQQKNVEVEQGDTGTKTVMKQKTDETVTTNKEEKNNEQSSNKEMSEAEPESKPKNQDRDNFDYGEKSSNFDTNKTVQIRDSGNRNQELRTKVEIMDEKDISQEEKDVPEFLQYYNDRYEKMKKLLLNRREMSSATTINRLERRNEGEQATTVGIVNDKYRTNSGKYIVNIEDNTGKFKALVEEREGDQIVQDEVIGIIGNMGGDIIYADQIVRPDLPIPQGVNTTEDNVEAAYISDMHLGSEDFLDERFDRFAKWLESDEASRIGYIVIAGDAVEGVGTYPGQEEELIITDIYKQYEAFEEWVEKIPNHIQLIIGPGNHDVTRLAEPQPRLPEKAVPRLYEKDNVHLIQNPQMVKLHGIESDGIKHLIYHGYSFDSQIDQIQQLRETAYDDPSKVMIDLLKRRHIAPTYGSNLMSPEGEDHLVIDEKPDVFVAGHLHSHAEESYKGVNVIASSTFQKQTDFQKRVGHEPDPGKVTIMNFKNRDTRIKQF